MTALPDVPPAGSWPVDPAPARRPLRGELWLVSLGAARPGEPGKTRPVVVVSHDSLPVESAHDLLVVVPVSSSMAPSGLRVDLPAAGLERPSRAICRAVRSVAASRFERPLGVVDGVSLSRIDDTLAVILGR